MLGEQIQGYLFDSRAPYQFYWRSETFSTASDQIQNTRTYKRFFFRHHVEIKRETKQASYREIRHRTRPVTFIACSVSRPEIICFFTLATDTRSATLPWIFPAKQDSLIKAGWAKLVAEAVSKPTGWVRLGMFLAMAQVPRIGTVRNIYLNFGTSQMLQFTTTTNCKNPRIQLYLSVIHKTKKPLRPDNRSPHVFHKILNVRVRFPPIYLQARDIILAPDTQKLPRGRS